MDRFTNDNPQTNMDYALNFFFVENGEAMVRAGGEHGENVTLREWSRMLIRDYHLQVDVDQDDELLDDDLDELLDNDLYDLLADGTSTPEGCLAILYRAGWAFAELRGRLKAYEDSGFTPDNLTALNAAAQSPNRLTSARCNGIKTGYWSPAKKDDLVLRLAAYEDTGLTPEQIRTMAEKLREVKKK